MLTPIKMPPGVFKNGTEYDQKGRWNNADQVRWYQGELQPTGGWTRVATGQLTGKPSSIFSWRDNDGDNYFAIGTHQKLYYYSDGSINDITPSGLIEGYAKTEPGAGFGAGPFDEEEYDTARTSTSLSFQATTWSLAAFGEILLASSTSDGNLYYWNPATIPTQSQAALISNAPTSLKGVLVSAERHVFAFGADGDPRKIAFSDREDFNTWTTAADNLAGDLLLDSPGDILCGRKIRNQILVWTTDDLHTINYLGAPLVYGVQKAGDACGIAGPNAVASTLDFAVWMGANGFFIYDGYVKPLACDVHDYVFGDMNTFQRGQVTAAVNSQFNEVWFFYPSSNSDYNDRYVIYNYRENHWSIGNLTRSAWSDSGVLDYPLAADPDGYLYQHEQGYKNAGISRVGNIFAETGPIDVANGDRNLVVTQLVPSGCANVPTCTQVKFELQQAPHAPATVVGPFTFGRPDGTADARFQAKQLQLRVEATADEPFRFGTLRLDARPGGRR